MRLKASKHIFIDGTFHHPPGFYQMLIIMYKDIIIDLKIPALYILLNSKKENNLKISLLLINTMKGGK